MKSVLVTGGAGYIGSHTVKLLLSRGYEVVVLDDLSTGHKNAVLTDNFYRGDIADKQLVANIIQKYHISAVIHFAAKSLVGESILKPDLYFENNVGKTVQLLSTLVENEVKHVVFSSTAAVYGLPVSNPISELEETKPINPYGESKLMIEKVLLWMEKAYGLKWCSLRYFNAAGADFDGILGEDHSPETHLIPLIMQTFLGQRESINIFGTDYPTKDGTCIRDYIHVLDLGEAHILSLEALAHGMKSQAINVGTGSGYSVRDIIHTAQQIVGTQIKYIESDRRKGDPAQLVARNTRIKEMLGWKPKYSLLETIIQTAWNWHRQHPNGYQSRKKEF